MLLDFNTLVEAGNIGFFNSCEVTQLFLIDKVDKTVTNFFIIAVLQESGFTGRNQRFLGDRVPVTKTISLGIQQYHLSIPELKTVFEELHESGRWNYEGDTRLKIKAEKKLPKQYILHTDGNSINKALKNNFDVGCYILEFFDETKTELSFILDYKERKKYEALCERVKHIIPIDLTTLRDRAGNVIFQFPINLVDISSSSLTDKKGVNISFAWHHLVKNIPDCLIEVNSKLDKNYMGAALVDYEKKTTQIVTIGNNDQKTTINLWRRQPNLLLFSFQGAYLNALSTNMGVVFPEPRMFEIDGVIQKVEIASVQRFTVGETSKKIYSRHISSRLYNEEQERLERSLAFKQYGIHNDQRDEALRDLRKLIETYDEAGVYLWDPYLRPEDILQTLYFSKTANVPLLAIGALNDSVAKIYGYLPPKQYRSKFRRILDILFEKKAGPKDYIQILLDDFKSKLAIPTSNNLGLKLEFRCQRPGYGWAFHDRFLIFPATEDRPAKAYSLGTSVNSFGKNHHHILQELSHPQRVVDAFEELWKVLDNNNCIVWKSR